jgi:hypothetical protein
MSARQSSSPEQEAPGHGFRRHLSRPVVLPACVILLLAAGALAWYSRPASAEDGGLAGPDGYWAATFPGQTGTWRFEVSAGQCIVLSPDGRETRTACTMLRTDASTFQLEFASALPLHGRHLVLSADGERRWVSSDAGRAEAQWATP